jgi:hypothetical protein
LNAIFAVGANIATVATIVYGFTLDRYGVRMNAFSGALLMALGFVLLAYSESSGGPFDAFIPGFSLVAFGGIGTYLPAFQFSVLFKRPTMILSIQSALFGVAGLTFTFFKYLYEDHGITRKTSFLCYAGLVGFCGVNMLLLYPAKSYRHGDQVFLPVLGWLGIQDPPKKQNELEEDSVVNAVSIGKGGRGGEYSPLREEDSGMLSGKQSRSSPSDVFPRSSSGSKILDSSIPNSVSYGSDLEQSPSTTGVVSPDPTKSLLPPKASEKEVAALKAARLVRDLTREEKMIVLNSRELKEELLNTGTILLGLQFSIGLLCANFYNANISTLLKNWGDSSGTMSNAFVFISSIYPCGFSLTIDWLQRKYRYAGTSALTNICMMYVHESEAEMNSCWKSLLLTSVCILRFFSGLASPSCSFTTSMFRSQLSSSTALAAHYSLL